MINLSFIKTIVVSSTSSFLKNNLLFISAKHSKIGMIALAALSLFVACYVLSHFARICFRLTKKALENHMLKIVSHSFAKGKHIDPHPDFTPQPIKESPFRHPESQISQEKDILTEAVHVRRDEGLAVSDYKDLLPQELALKQNDFSISSDKILNGVAKINQKLVSKRTLNCLKKLDIHLRSFGKIYGTAIDNGDCFFDAYAKGLQVYLKRAVTIKELRQKVADYVHTLEAEENNWIKKMIQKEYIALDNYEVFKERVGFTCEEVLQKKWPAPIWGQQQREGVILCHIYKVNLKIYEVGYLDEDPSKMDHWDNFWESEPCIYPSNEKYNHTIEMAIYPGHFLPVFDAVKLII
jgi:hypothetical protein